MFKELDYLAVVVAAIMILGPLSMAPGYSYMGSPPMTKSQAP